jgi:nucleoid-associated protein YgaU
MLIVGLVAVLMASGAAMAAPTSETKVPVTMSDDQEPALEPRPEVVVVKGDHLWKISARHVDDHSPGGPIAPYWIRVIEANTPSLRSGDPDLIYPGEVIRLPEISERP